MRVDLRDFVAAVVLGLAAAPVAAQPNNPFADSMPRTVGTATVPGLTAPVTIDRDEKGVPVIRAATLLDAVRGQGFVHAQDRFLQMDLLRRAASGRLAEVVGAAVVGRDEYARRHRFQRVADGVCERARGDERAMLEAYAQGVNAGLADLASAPPIYGLISAKPARWSAPDTILCNLTMSEMLNFSASIEKAAGVMNDTLPAELVRFLTPLETRFESPLVGPARPATPLAVPGPDVVDLRTRGAGRHPGLPAGPDGSVVAIAPAIGSNNWAVAGSRTRHGGAILANDPHLQITVPGVWYRCELAWGDGEHAAGVSLPGSPGILIGSNTKLAWGFTNTQADFQDLIVIEVDPDDPDRYRTPDGWQRFGSIDEVIPVRGAALRRLTLKTTRWGVVTGEDWQGRPLVLKWTGLDPEIINTSIIRMMTASTIEDGIEIARAWYGPSQNVLLADRGGRIAWVVSGYFPRRRGFDGSVPVSWAEAGVGWDGAMDETRRPMIVDPPEGILYTANNRTVDVAWARTIGHAWDLGARAKRIGEMLRASDAVDEDDLRRMQLDTRLEIFDFYRDLIVEVAAGAPAGSPAAEARAIVAAWDGTAEPDGAGLPILDSYRRRLFWSVVEPLVAPCRAADPSYRYRWFTGEEPVRRLLEERPAHLLPPGYRDWSEFLLRTLNAVLEPIESLDVRWGDVNRSRVSHPVAMAVPAFARMLNMPEAPLPGHAFAVRVAMPSFGASMRMVVSPGRETNGFLHTPAGQSGHPFSPHYRDGHDAWLAGAATPFLGGASAGRITLAPPEAGAGGPAATGATTREASR